MKQSNLFNFSMVIILVLLTGACSPLYYQYEDEFARLKKMKQNVEKIHAKVKDEYGTINHLAVSIIKEARKNDIQEEEPYSGIQQFYKRISRQYILFNNRFKKYKETYKNLKQLSAKSESAFMFSSEGVELAESKNKLEDYGLRLRDTYKKFRYDHRRLKNIIENHEIKKIDPLEFKQSLSELVKKSYETIRGADKKFQLVSELGFNSDTHGIKAEDISYYQTILEELVDEIKRLQRVSSDLEEELPLQKEYIIIAPGLYQSDKIELARRIQSRIKTLNESIAEFK